MCRTPGGRLTHIVTVARSRGQPQYTAAHLPPLLTLLGGAALTLVLISAANSWWTRRRLVARIRETWGRPRAGARQMTTIAEYFRSRAAVADADEFLDDRTWQDLDLDAVFAQLDRTESTLGQQALYCRLRNARAAADLEPFERVVCRMAADDDARERAQVVLSRLQNPAGYDVWWLAQPGSIERRPWHLIYPVLAAAMLAAVLLSFLYPGALLVVLVGSVVNLIVRGITATRVTSVVGPFRQLSAVIGVAEALRAIETDERSILGTLSGDLTSLRVLKRIVRRASPDPLASNDVMLWLMEYLNLLFLIDVNTAYFAAGELRRCGPALLRVIGAVGDVDAAISVASIRADSRRWTRPVFVAAGSPVTFTAMSHPLVEEAVPNSLQLRAGTGALITGSNMSGKTTFIRTAGVNAVLAQTINTCFAETYEAPVLRVRSCIGRSDDLLSGKSYYLAELEAVLSLVAASSRHTPHLFLLDELFRGTNAIERIAAGEAVLTELIAPAHRTTKNPHYALAATHDGELVEYLAGLYQPLHFGDRLDAAGVTFDYRLRDGVTHTRNALALLRVHGGPDGMVARAVERAGMLDRSRSRQRGVGGITPAKPEE